ncbi:MAG: carboxypeptidase-like regulatory domain-containing protein [Longimicrobiales bacterium]|nr:carboxypeptidase-like regulatory domain-containing protein [Longimicrobiales bacterium]
MNRRILTAGRAVLLGLLLAATGVSAQVVIEVHDATSWREIHNARIELANAPRHGGIALTSEEGRATLDGVRAGMWTLRVQALGYETRELRVEVLPDTTTFVRVDLAAAPVALDSLAVTTDPISPRLLDHGFYDRSATNVGYFYDAERLQRIAGGGLLTNKLRYLQRVRIRRVGRRRIIMIGRTCRPVFYLDGQYIRGIPLDDMIRADVVVGVEIYDQPQFIPKHFRLAAGRAGIAGPDCGVIAIWTRYA